MPSAKTARMKAPRSPRAAKVPDQVMQYVLANPWAISQAGLERILAIASRLTITPEALQQYAGKPLDNTRSTTIRDGVATISIDGPLLKRASWFNAISGAVDYGSIAADLRVALDDRAVNSIVMVIDSPGGEVHGCSELAQLIREGRDEKPIYAYVDGDCCSAAFWLAASCTKVYVSNTSILGNMGVRVTMSNDDRKVRAEGIDRVTIVSSQTPAKPHDATTEPGRERVQALVDSLATEFINGVAEGRGIDAATVQKDYGAGAVFVGAAAVENGLADEVTNYEALLASLAAAPSGALTQPKEAIVPTNTKGRAQSKSAAPKAAASVPRPKGEDTPPKEEDKKEAADDGESTPATCPECDAELPEGAKFCPECGAEVATDDATAEGEPAKDESDKEKPKDGESASATIRTAAATAERERILGILGYASRFGLDAVMPMVNDATCTKEGAAAKLLELGPTAGGHRLRALRADEAGVQNAPKQSASTTALPGASAGTNRLFASLARTKPAALPDSVKAGSSSK